MYQMSRLKRLIKMKKASGSYKTRNVIFFFGRYLALKNQLSKNPKKLIWGNRIICSKDCNQHYLKSFQNGRAFISEKKSSNALFFHIYPTVPPPLINLED